ncbi:MULTISPECIES: glutamate ABC transporter substrate-binding protein [Actinosynnema]|uniref:glutamate ABC transporter substrate-binding protein n=1 Tax=Actinosynnema TaxID=40566 RepID=UPI0020A3513F|nr:glutamate ABC transporter substrate-binding protein [Actinosynnema pretiosum]MCP2096245.1 amino acid ABC transporter substrate-binding protein, PAAT family [Actinosynnema pretiosum]
MRARRGLVVAAALLATACAPVPSSAPPIGGDSAVRPGPAEATVLPREAQEPTAGQDCTASLRPPRPLPAPGAMPAGSTMRRIAERGQLVVGVDQNTYLMGFRDPFTGELQGFDVDLAREVARSLLGDPTKVRFRVLNSDQRLPALETGEVDVVVRTMTITCERWRRVNFSTSYYEAGQRVLVPKDSGITGLTALSGRKVCATTGSSSLAHVRAHPSGPVPVAVPNWTDCLVMLQQGQVDAISTDDTILAGFAAQDPYTEVVGPRLTTESYGIGVARGADDLTRFVNGVLERVRADGTWARIHRKWLGDPPVPPRPEYRD